jgi:hypothetical protein
MRLRRDLVSPDRLVVALACAVAVLSVVVGLRSAVPHLAAWKRDYGALSESGRTDLVARSLGFDPRIWNRLRIQIRRDDRYVIVASGISRFEVRNYAAYTLLPAIQVSERGTASVVIFYETVPPRGVPCTPVGRRVCVTRPPRS